MKNQKSNLIRCAGCALLLITLNFQLSAAPLGTAFTYQGKLVSGGNAANGIYDFTFAVWNAASGGAQQGAAFATNTVPVTNGYFVVTLDFGPGVFPGDSRWLEIWVRTNGVVGFTTLTPRQQLTPSPYAIMATSASNLLGTLPAAQLTGTVGNGQLANSSVTVSAGTGLSGGGAVALGGSTTLNNAGVLSLTGNADITVSAASGNITLGDTATSASAAGTIVKRDASGNFSAGTITGNLAGNATTANSFTGPLAGDVTGAQATTVVSSVGGQSAANVATGVSTANAATAANTPGTIVKRDGSGNFSAGAITGVSLSGDGSGLNNLNGGSITGGTVTSAQLAPGAALTNLAASGQSGVPSGALVLSTNFNDANLASAGYVKLAGQFTLGNAWQPRAACSLVGRDAHTAVWTGSEMLVWGGATAGNAPLNDGARYNPVMNSWTAMTPTNAPSARWSHTAVWTGTEMIVWGGYDGSSFLNTGGRYNPVSNSWTTVSTTGAPSGRYLHTAVWTGNEMIVWGGAIGTGYGALTNDGGRYNPLSNSWTALATNGAPAARMLSPGLWTGSEMIIWGGYQAPNDGGRYNPLSNSWVAVTTNGAPSARWYPAAVWTGTEMIVWGGYGSPSGPALNDGGRYNPTANAWTPVTAAGAPSARYAFTGVWAGSEMIIFGGYNGSSSFNDTFSYTPSRNLYLYQRP
jgi:N-acetylneuraminic acid mutarotase